MVALTACALACAPAALAAPEPRERTVTSFDGTPIQARFFPAAGLRDGVRVPTVLIGHGFGGTGTKLRTTDTSVGGQLLRAGYNVLTWDARGFGDSGGKVHIDDPRFEGRDVQALIDFVARQPEVQLDAPGDPRLGMTGGSYAGAIQFVAAGLDRRVDVINPIIAWNTLPTSLNKAGRLKLAWGLLLIAGGSTSLTGGIDKLQFGTYDTPVLSAVAQASAAGRFGDPTLRYFADKGPGALLNRIRIPTLIQQGVVDTLFTLTESISNYEVLSANGAPLRMMWFCGGHGVCNGNSGARGYNDRATLRWFARWLKRDGSVDTGPPFEWISDTDGAWHSAEQFLPVTRDPLVGTGSGSLPISILQTLSGTSGLGLSPARPASSAVNIDVPAPARAVDVVGVPRLRFTYRGTAIPAPDTHLFAQIVDLDANRVLGNNVTPVPVKLDGATHTTEIPLEAVASRGRRYRVQIAAGSTLYYLQNSLGSVDISNARVQLPVIDASLAPALGVGRLGGSRRAPSVALRAVNSGLRNASVVLERRAGRRWRRVGSSRTVDLRGVRRRRVGIRVRSRLRAGSYRIRARGYDRAARERRGSRRQTLR